MAPAVSAEPPCDEPSSSRPDFKFSGGAMVRSISILRSSVLALLASAALTACGGPLHYAPKGTPKAPEADAQVTAEVDEKASMTHLSILAEHLAPPARLQDGASTYVVWTRKNDGAQ